MSEEELEWLLDIATPTGISYSGDQTITIDFANKVINHINKQKEILDKIKDICLENMYVDDRGGEPEKVERDIRPSKILELLEEIE